MLRKKVCDAEKGMLDHGSYEEAEKAESCKENGLTHAHTGGQGGREDKHTHNRRSGSFQ